MVDDDIAALEGERDRLLRELEAVKLRLLAARKAKFDQARAARGARLNRVALMMKTSTIAEIARAEGIGTSRAHVLVHEAKRRGFRRSAT